MRSVNLEILPATALRNSGDSSLVDKVGLLSLVFASVLVVVLLSVILTMLGLRRRAGKTEIYRPVHSCGGEADLLYSHSQPGNISYIDLYGHCSASQTGEVRSLLPPPPPSPHCCRYQAVRDHTKDSHSSSGLGSSSASFNDTGSDCGDVKSVKTFRETHFDNYESKTLPSSQYGEQCPRSVHAVHSLPYTLFHCQHSCFNQHNQHNTLHTNHTNHHHGQPA